jgi:putative methionine-R-sulfoxide reductase with GAF domain
MNQDDTTESQVHMEHHDRALEAIRAALAPHGDQNSAMEMVVRELKQHLPDYTWVGIYLLDGNELVLGPFAGKPSPHTRIPLGQGICGAAAAEKATIVVDDVNADPRYLACTLETQSEIVVPIMHDGDVLGELDVDSDRPAAFGDADRVLLETVAALLVPPLTRGRDAANTGHS